MKYLVILLTFFLVSCSKPNIDVWDRLMDKIDNFKNKDKISQSDQNLVRQATDKEWEEVDKETEKVIIPKKKPAK
tara:strand:+ start:531 stop:755 length:225 start_codon:yes stop_codon:yes gene_type:complete